MKKAGGSSIRITGLCKNLSKNNDVTIFSRNDLPKEISDRVTNIKLKNFYLPPNYFLISSFLPEILISNNMLLLNSPGALQLINSDFDILQCNQHVSALIGLMLKQKIQLPILFDMHGLLQSETKLNLNTSIKDNLLYKLYIKAEKSILSRSYALSTPSEEMSDFVSGAFGLPREKIFTIPDGADINLFNSTKRSDVVATRNNIDAVGRRIIMYVGGISPLHDSINFLKSLYLINKKIKKEVLFVIITHGPSVTKIRAEYFELIQGLDNLVMHPPIPHDILPIYLKAADLLVIPYTNDLFSNMVPHLKTLEYMASGTPIVASRTRGIRNLLEHKINAVLVEPESPESMANGIIYALENEEMAKEMGINARKCVSKHHSWEISARKALEAYTMIIERWENERMV
jgi:glycosyltransferase involved in cell wall biosynthesis